MITLVFAALTQMTIFPGAATTSELSAQAVQHEIGSSAVEAYILLLF